MKKVRLYESFHDIDEAKLSKIHNAAKKGSYPVTLVVIENGKVVKQELVGTPQIVPAAFNQLKKEYPKATVHVEDKGGQTLFVEGIDVTEAKADGTISDDEDERRAALVKRVKEQMEEILASAEFDANDIGGSFRAPGIIAEVRKEIERQVKKFR